MIRQSKNLVLTNRGLKYKTEEYSLEIIYEVFRIINGIPLFLEDHFNRLQRSIEIKGLVLEISFVEFKQKITELIRLSQKTEGNVKFVYSVEKGNIHWAFTFISHHYPTEDDYLSGVLTDLLFAEREVPNAKVIQASVRERADQMIADQNLYEVFLVGRNGLITEGSRSNVFFVKDDVFYTAPPSLVLAGITRQKVIECLHELNFRVVEEAVCVKEINRFDAVFLTGTSPKVLPVRAIGNLRFQPQLWCVKKIMDLYNDKITRYIRAQND